MEQFAIPGIHAVYAVKAEALTSDIRKMQLAGIIIPLAAVPVYMHAFGEIRLNAVSTMDNPSVSLEFSSLVNLPDHNFAFVAENRHGLRFLIGASEPPFPKVEATMKNDRSSNRIDYKISWAGHPAICTCQFHSSYHDPVF